jgi:hypothetical protein
MFDIILKRHYIVKKIMDQKYIQPKIFSYNGLDLLKYISGDKTKYLYKIDTNIMDEISKCECYIDRDYNGICQCLTMIKYLYSIGIKPIYRIMNNACNSRNLDLVKFLYGIGMNPTYSNLQYSIKCGSIELIEYLTDVCGLKIQQCHEIDSFMTHPNNDLYFIKRMYNKYNIKLTSYSIDHACKHGSLIMVKYLYSIGVPVNNMAMYDCIIQGRFEIVKFLHETCGIKFTRNHLNLIYGRKNNKDIVDYIKANI